MNAKEAKRGGPATGWPANGTDERGVALILALLVMTLLVALVLSLDAEARRELREAAAFRDGLKATTLAKSGLQAARAILQQDAQEDAKLGRTFDAATDLWALPISNLQLGDGTIAAAIEDERAKLNLNELANQPDPIAKKAKVEKFKRLFELLQLDARLVDGLMDWVDADDEPEPNGAESVFYQSLRPPYRAANTPLTTLAELHLIKGFTSEIVRRLSPYVTVYPLSGDGGVNINTADPLVIQALDARLTPAMALEIMQGRPYRTPQDVDRVASVEPIAKALRLTGAYQVTTDHFGARLTATVTETTKTARAVLYRNASTGQTSLLYYRVE